MRVYENGIYRDLTPEELAQMESEQRKQELYEKSRPFTMEEVSNMMIAASINTLQVDDNTALRMLTYYPEWGIETNYAIGYKVQYNGKLYRVIQEHTSQEAWKPDVTASLYTVINETHSGLYDDPITYSGNMALEKDKYYMENYVEYLCIRDTINPVFNPLAELVGIYVEEVV